MPTAPGLVDVGALGGDAPDDVVGAQYRCYFVATSKRGFARNSLPQTLDPRR
jgi:hypothetical protein